MSPIFATYQVENLHCFPIIFNCYTIPWSALTKSVRDRRHSQELLLRISVSEDYVWMLFISSMYGKWNNDMHIWASGSATSTPSVWCKILSRKLLCSTAVYLSANLHLRQYLFSVHPPTSIAAQIRLYIINLCWIEAKFSLFSIYYKLTRGGEDAVIGWHGVRPIL